MNIEALEWFRVNSVGTEMVGLVYFDGINMGGGVRYSDKVRTKGLKFLLFLNCLAKEKISFGVFSLL